MLQTIFYDTSRFKTDKFAELAGELYKVRYSGYDMIVTRPDKSEFQIRLQVSCKTGLSMVDEGVLRQWMSDDMTKRKEENERNQVEFAGRVKAHKEKMAKREKTVKDGISKKVKEGG